MHNLIWIIQKLILSLEKVRKSKRKESQSIKDVKTFSTAFRYREGIGGT